MSRLSVPILPTLVLLLMTGLQLRAQESGEVLELSDFLTASEMQAFQQKPDYRDRMGLMADVLERLGKRISRQTKAQDYPGIERTLLELRSVSAHGIRLAAEPHTAKDGRSRKVKQLEIELRRLVEDLEDLKLKVHFELRLVYEEIAAELEKYRNDVLALLFEGSDRISRRPTPALQQRAGLALAPPGFVSEAVQRRRRGGIQGDQFTDVEFEKVQDAQKLLDRVKVFLEIAESRLSEIVRRREGTEWKGDKDQENPLEFYTVAQMVHAYDRSIEGIMIFIDEKATNRLASEKDIKKALTLLNKKIQEFIPQLEPIRQEAFDAQDEELYNEVRSAMKNSDAALKGSQLGLGAPANN